MLTHKGTITISTDRLILRRFKIDDADDMFNNWSNDEQVTKFLTWRPHGNIGVTEDIIRLWINGYENDDVYNWVIEFKETGEAIGGISIVRMDENNYSCEIGYCMSKEYWGKGIMTETVTAVIDFLFLEVGFNRIEAKHDTNNPASGRVMAKSGMKYEGTLRQVGVRNEKEFYDLSIYSILKDEWSKKGTLK